LLTVADGGVQAADAMTPGGVADCGGLAWGVESW